MTVSSSDRAAPGVAPISYWRAVLRGLGDGSLGSAATVDLARRAGAHEDAEDEQPGIGASRATAADERGRTEDPVGVPNPVD